MNLRFKSHFSLLRNHALPRNFPSSFVGDPDALFYGEIIEPSSGAKEVRESKVGDSKPLKSSNRQTAGQNGRLCHLEVRRHQAVVSQPP